MTTDAWDYIVVGAGHNGLSAACRLATSGATVIVVEQLPIIGGLSTSHAYVDAAPHHVLSIGAMDDMLLSQSSLARDYRLADYGYAVIELDAPYGWMNEDGDSLLLFRDFERTLSDIRYFSPKDAETYRDLRRTVDWLLDIQARLGAAPPMPLGVIDTGKLLIRMARDKSIRRTVTRMLGASALEIISETFESDAMRGLWAFWASMSVPANVDGTGFALLGFGAVHRGGVFRPRGGMTNLIGALRANLERHGGEIRAGIAVKQILVSDNRAMGVELSDGSVLHARQGVLASCAPQIALGQLLGNSVLDRQTRTAVLCMPANSGSTAPFKIDAAIGGRLSYPRAEKKRAQRDGAEIRRTTFMTGTLEDHIAHLQAIKNGQSVSGPPVYMAILSATDPSLAPAGEDVLYLYSNCPVEPAGGWERAKASYSDVIRASAKRFIGGLEAELGSVESSPRDFERTYSLPRGCYFHVDMLVTRMGRNRPAKGLGDYVTPIDRLYLAGSGSHPGGGVSGWPGRLAAERALKIAGRV